MESFPSTKEIWVKPVVRQHNWLPKGHDGEFMFTGCKAQLCVPKSRSVNALINPLNGLKSDELKRIADALAITVQDLNPNKKDNNFWENRYVRLDKTSKKLDLTNVHQYIDYAILLTNREIVASSWENRLNLGSYRFALVDDTYETKTRSVDALEKSKAYIEFGKMHDKPEMLKDFLWLYYKAKRMQNRPGRDWNIDMLISEVHRILEDDTVAFMEQINKPHFHEEALIHKAIDASILERRDHKYYVVGSPETLGTYEETVKYLSDPEFQKVKLGIVARLENTK